MDPSFARDVVKASALGAARKLADYSVGLLKFVGDDAAPLGSGTLVKIGSAHGIVTAAHVWDVVEREPRVGFYQNPLRRSEIQSTYEATLNLVPIRIGKSPYAEAGPDLAFIKLPEAKVPLLQMHGTFLNVDRHQQLTAERDQSDDYRLDAVVGMVEEWEKAVTTANRGKVICFNVLTNVGHAQKMLGAELEGDRYLFEPAAGEDLALPSSYGGVSGGGLFRVFVDEHVVSKVALFGVAYWETKTDGKADKIVCHGPESIHGMLAPLVRKRWP